MDASDERPSDGTPPPRFGALTAVPCELRAG